jgi:sulfoxide reductase heme-binding subunit YedZ
LTYLGLDHFFDWDSIVEDVLERRFVTAGFAALLCLAPLAATSTRTMARRLGRRWKALHRLVYIATALTFIHWIFSAFDVIPAIAHLVVIVALESVRVFFNSSEKRASR